MVSEMVEMEGFLYWQYLDLPLDSFIQPDNRCSPLRTSLFSSHGMSSVIGPHTPFPAVLETNKESDHIETDVYNRIASWTKDWTTPA